jgi:hypothetical protein
MSSTDKSFSRFTERKRDKTIAAFRLINPRSPEEGPNRITSEDTRMIRKRGLMPFIRQTPDGRQILDGSPLDSVQGVLGSNVRTVRYNIFVDLPRETYITEFNTAPYSISVDFGTPKQIVTIDVSGFYDVPTPLLANITYTRYGGFYIFETADNLYLYDNYSPFTYSSEIFKKHFLALMTVTYTVLSSEVLRPALIVLNESGTVLYQSNPISALNKDTGYLIRNGDYVEL